VVANSSCTTILLEAPWIHTPFLYTAKEFFAWISGKPDFVLLDVRRPQPGIYVEIRRINGGWPKVSPQEADTMDLGKNECGASNYGKVGVSAEVQRCAV